MTITDGQTPQAIAGLNKYECRLPWFRNRGQNFQRAASEHTSEYRQTDKVMGNKRVHLFVDHNVRILRRRRFQELGVDLLTYSHAERMYTSNVPYSTSDIQRRRYTNRPMSLIRFIAIRQSAW